MMKKCVGAVRLSMLVLSGLAAGLSATSVSAGVLICGNSGTSCALPTVSGATTSSGKRDTTEAFAGINWAFGTGPELVLGVRSLRTDARRRVEGARLETTFPFSMQNITFDKLRLRLVGGHRSGMYELGGGYSFVGKGFLLSSALQTDYFNVGTDLTLSDFKWQPFVGVNTLERAKAPTVNSSGTLACAPGAGDLTSVTDLLNNAGTSVAPELQLSGFTCYQAN